MPTSTTSKTTRVVLSFMACPACSKCGSGSVDCLYRAEVNAIILTCARCGYVSACEPRHAPRQAKGTRTIELPEVEADDDEADDDDGAVV